MGQQIFFTSDLHFGHRKMLKEYPHTRPWGSVEEMDEGIVDHWNSRVKPDDLVYHLGDWALTSAERTFKLLSRLNGIIFCIEGNHDKYLPRLAAELSNIYVLRDIHLFKHQKRKWVCSHYPLDTWEGMYYGVRHIHGHCHGNLGNRVKTITSNRTKQKIKTIRMDISYDAVGSILSFNELDERLENLV